MLFAGACMAIDLNDRFKLALDLMANTNQHLFITGKAGTGKSTLLQYFCNNSSHQPVVLAPTGVAALNVKGQTIHRFFNFYIDVTPAKIINNRQKPRNAKLYRQLKTIIIDEVSMLRADLLDCIDVFLRRHGPDSSLPFGGVQLILIGDLYQLPPVVGRQERDFFCNTYASPYFFSAKVMAATTLRVVELEKVYRQKDKQFVALLNKIRTNLVSQDDIDELNQRYTADFATVAADQLTISLTATKSRAAAINDRQLQAIDGQLYSSQAIVSGDFAKEYYPTAAELQFKIDAQIMLLNNDHKKRWVNGSMATITAVGCGENNEQYLRVRLRGDNRQVTVEPFLWELYNFKVADGAIVSEPAGSFSQYPFRLAWAITIHKSQGKTFDRVIIDIGNGSFAAGQTYVALSRCRSFSGIKLKVPIRKSDIRIDRRIYQFLNERSGGQWSPRCSAADKLAVIKEAISARQRLAITYFQANDAEFSGIITPLTVGEASYRGNVFTGMRAYCATIDKKLLFNVARIVDVQAI